MKRLHITLTLLISLFCFYSAGNVYACPDIQGLTDLNCDKRIVIACFGDSITSGVRDATGLGYPGRLMLGLPGVEVVNLGVPGEQTFRGKARAASLLPTLPEADYTIILEGVNDFFIDGQTTSATRSNLQSIMQSSSASGSSPILGRLTPVNRTDQGIWVRDLNSAISSLTKIDFNSFNKRTFLSSDNLHPHGDGYQAMAERAIATLLSISLSNKPADTDGDGVYDFAEPRFGASPSVVDTDGDTIPDGVEIFTYGSNPNSLDSDGDGFSDQQEVNEMGSDPASPYPSAPNILDIEVTDPQG